MLRQDIREIQPHIRPYVRGDELLHLLWKQDSQGGSQSGGVRYEYLHHSHILSVGEMQRGRSGAGCAYSTVAADLLFGGFHPIGPMEYRGSGQTAVPINSQAGILSGKSAGGASTRPLQGLEES